MVLKTIMAKLNYGNKTLLRNIDCSNKNLASLNVNKNILLETLNCKNNFLKTLDLSNNHRLLEVKCDKEVEIILSSKQENKDLLVKLLPHCKITIKD